jgi:hypothetical protein
LFAIFLSGFVRLAAPDVTIGQLEIRGDWPDVKIQESETLNDESLGKHPFHTPSPF